MTEESLPATTGAIKDATRLGETGEMALCAPFGLKIQCFPTTLNPLVNTTPSLRSPKGDLLPMAHALAGKTGFINTQDYRNQEVEAAYAPVGDLGLGMVLKMDSAELHAPTWSQLRYLVPLLLGVLLIALLTLRWLLAPLVLRLVQSEAQAREMSASLRNSEEHFRQLFETSLESILQTRPDGQVLNANPAACALFGMSVQEMRERGRGGLVDTSDPRLPALLEERGRNGQASGELRSVRGDGSVFECELSSSIYLDLNNQPCSNIVLRDITARKSAEAHITSLNAELEQRVGERTAQLEASNRDLQEFAHSVAHDLRQPFIAIGGFIGLLERSVEDERARHYVNRIKDGVRQAGELTDALLALANLSRVELRLQEVDLSTLAFSVMDKLQQKDPARVCRIQIEPGLRAQADAMLIRLVLQELLGNAWKFSSRRACAEISFGLEPTDPQAPGTEPVYVVRDNGEGFDMAHADKLFRSFQRLHSPEEFSGVGVGLANIQRIVTRHGGRIWAESARGEGSAFFFTLGNARP
jgi:PAS domain S-box-containing protein